MGVRVLLFKVFYMKLWWTYAPIPTVFEDEDKEIGQYTTLYTDLWTFEILMSLEELQEELKKVWKWFFKFKKLDEYSQVLEHYWELVLDMSKAKILWFREHTIIHDRKKQKEINEQGLSVNN